MALQQTSTEWARIANTTLSEYIDGETNLLMRQRKVFAMLQKKGRIKYGQSGDGFVWTPRVKRATVQVNNLEQTLQFSRVNRWKNAFLDMAGYAVTDAVTKRERLKNKSGQAIIKIFSGIGERIRDDLEDAICEETYVDSSATGNSGRLSGLETMFAATQTITVTSGAARSANAADPCYYPNDTYAGLSTVLGSVGGGTWNTSTDINSTWPYGRGRSEYDVWSPVIVQGVSTAFGGSSWAENCVKATRYGIDAINGRVKASQGEMNFIIHNNGGYRQYKDKLDPKERIAVSSTTGLRSLGFTDVIEQDGVEITSEFGVPNNAGYGLNMKMMTLRSWLEGDKLFEVEGPEYNMAEQGWLVACIMAAQFQFVSPRSFCKWVTG